MCMCIKACYSVSYVQGIKACYSDRDHHKRSRIKALNALHIAHSKQGKKTTLLRDKEVAVKGYILAPRRILLGGLRLCSAQRRRVFVVLPMYLLLFT